MSSRYESLTGTVDGDFPEYGQPPGEPMELVRQWVGAATEAGVREPLALALATAGRDGRISSRIVGIIELRTAGLVFTTHDSSRKGREIAESGWASGLLYWRETAQQLSISGPVARLPEAEADRLWAARAVPLHPMSTASLRAEADQLAATGTPLPRPARFTGYRLEPAAVEFWSAADDRLHRRLRYDRTPTGWHVVRLQP